MIISDMEVSYIAHCGSDLSVVNAARVSFNKESEFLEGNDLFDTPYGWQRWNGESFEAVKEGEAKRVLDERDAKLIRYLAKHKHFSPFNHSFISLRIKAPVFVARQLVKHKFLPWNEVSRRYVDSEPEFYFPTYWRQKADNVKQGSSDEYVDNDIGVDHGWKFACEAIAVRYEWMLEQGVCPEQARMVLPQNMMTEWIWSGTLGAYCDMLRLRLDPHTQLETREVAQKVHSIIEPLFPVSVKELLSV